MPGLVVGERRPAAAVVARGGKWPVRMGPRPGTVEEILPVELPRPRWDYDFRATPQFLERRAYLWQRIRSMVADQPEFRFFPRDETLASVGHPVG